MTPGTTKSNYNLKSNTNVIQATSNNPIYYSLNLAFSNSFVPSVRFGISKSFSFDNTILSNFNLSLTYDSLSKVTDKKTLVSINPSLSGRIIGIPWSLGGTGNINFNANKLSSYSYSLYLSLSFPFIKKTYLSLSLTANGSNTERFKLTGSLYATINIGSNGTISVGESPSYTTLNYNTNIGGYNLSLGSTLPSLFKLSDFRDIKNYSGSFGISKAFNPFSLSLSGSASNSLSSLRLNLSTQSLLAGGMFLMTSSIPDNILLVKKDKNLKHGTFEGSSIGSSAVSKLPVALGGHYYKASNSYTSAMLYFTDKDNEFTSTQSWAVTLPDKGISLIKLKGNVSYSVFGEVEDFYNESSPIYNIEINENAINIIGINEEQYLFTDTDGIFNLSDVQPGLYAFDSKKDGNWYLNIIKIDEEQMDNKLINHLKIEDSNLSYSSPYVGVNIYSFDRSYSSDEYWALFYGEDL